MNIRLYNARILTMEPGREVFYGEIWVKNDKIAYVAEQKELAEEWDRSQFPRIAWDIELDCKGNLLMPGFKNAHTHSGMTFLRSMADDMPLDQWLNKQVFPLEAKLTGEDIYDLTRLAVLEYLTSGVTSIFDMYLTPDTIAEACLDTGMRCVLVSGLNNFSSSPKQVEEEFLKWNKKNSLISYQLGFHAEYTCSKELLWKVSEMAHHYRTPVYAHISETEKEVEECKARYGMTPPMFLDSLGMFDYGGGGFHCVHVTDQDLDVFRRHHMYVITNPGSNTKLASGIAPIADYVRHKIPVAIGTDGPASNNCLDMFREMFLVTGLSKLLEKDAASMDAMEVLKMATVNGAKAMRLNRADVLAKGKYADLIMIGTDGPASNNCLDMFREMFLVTGLSKLLEKDAASMDAMEVLKMATVNGAKAMRLNRADVLAKGKYADLIMIDLHQPNMQPIHNIPKNLVYSGSKSNVCMTMIGGKILYRNGEFNVGEDPERIYAKCEKIVKRLLTE